MLSQAEVALVHEAGHVAMAHLMGFPVYEAKSFADGTGHVVWGTIGDAKTARGRLVCSAGAAAEIVMFGRITSETKGYMVDIRMGGWKSWRSFEASARRGASLLTESAILMAKLEVEVWA